MFHELYRITSQVALAEKNPLANAGNAKRHGFNPWVEKIPWGRERLSTSGFWPGDFHGLYSPWGCIESDTIE